MPLVKSTPSSTLSFLAGRSGDRPRHDERAVTAARALGASGAAAAGAGVLVFALWKVLGLPDGGMPLDAPVPGLWRWFFAIGLPILFPAFTAAHLALARRAPPGPARAAATAARGWDRWSYVLLALFVPWLVAWRGAPAWRLALGGFFVSVLFAKTLLLVAALYRTAFGRADPEDDRAALPGGAAFLGVAALLLYAGLAPYVVTAVSTAGDEPFYLLTAHSLLTDRDVALANNARQGDAAPFYWGRGTPWESVKGQDRPGHRGFPSFLLPAYALGRALLPGYPLAGRLAATLFIAVCAALLGIVAYRLSRELGCPRPAAFWAWVTLALTPPFIVASGHLYPEVPAALLALVGVRAVLKLPGDLRAGLAGAGAAAAALIVLKQRYAALGLGLVGWAALRVRRRWSAGALLLVGAGAIVVLLLLMGTPRADGIRRIAGVKHSELLTVNHHMVVALVGLVADQQFGLLFFAPAWMLALMGLPALWRRRRDAARGLLGLFTLYLLVVVKFRWFQWDAGWTPPPRFILSAAPLLTPFVAAGIERLRGPRLAAIHTLCLVWSTDLAWCLAVVPFWRYNGLTGRATVLGVAGEKLGLDLARFLPSVRNPSPGTWLALGAGSVILIVATVLAARRRVDPALGWGLGAVLLRPWPAAGLVAAVVVAWLTAAAVIPTRRLEAEAMRHGVGMDYGAYLLDPILWIIQRDGEISERIVTWPGVTRITVVAGGYTTTGTAPRMTVQLDDRVVGDWTLDAGAGTWLERRYVASVPTRFGRPTLQLRFVQTRDQRGSGQMQHAYVDRILLERVSE
jgi:hypothetical protein